MNKQKTPFGEPATLKQRKEYYEKEFSIKKVKKWFQEFPIKQKPLFEIILGRHTSILPKEYKKYKNETISLDTAPSYEKLKKELVEFLPEGVYYSRNFFKKWKQANECNHFNPWKCNGFTGQELVIDIDPENFKNPNKLSFGMKEFEKAKQETIELYEALDFSRKKIVYSGRGFHLHIWDKEAFKWSKKEKKEFAKQLTKEGFVQDEWVTSGEYYLIRLPYSLHGGISRICLPLSKRQAEKFNPQTNKKSKPKFLLKK